MTLNQRGPKLVNLASLSSEIIDLLYIQLKLLKNINTVEAVEQFLNQMSESITFF